MLKAGFVLLIGFCLIRCSNEKGPEQDGDNGIVQMTTEGLSKRFKELALPYQLTDTMLLKWNDTTSIQFTELTASIPDSIRSPVFGKNGKIKYQAIGRVNAGKNDTYFLVRASSGSKAAAYLMSFGKDNKFAAAFPFLIPDNDPATSQVSMIDKSLSISKNVLKSQPNSLNAEGKDVFIYNSESRQFMIIMTDPLDDTNLELINPIDTLRKTHRFAGDYGKGKRNIVSIRDGRAPNQLMAFVHLENQDGCSGELKGELLMTSATTAIYRQGGDPCVLQFRFSGNTIELQEEEGCGNHRGLDCAFTGTFPKKKEAKAKTSEKKERK